MRKIISILILCSLLVYMGGYHLVAALHRYSIKQEMRAYLMAHKDEKFGTHFRFQEKDCKVSDPNFGWEETNKEFKYKGEKYDVVSLEHENGQIRIYALKDTRENDLEKQLANIKPLGNKSQGNQNAIFFKFFSSFCSWNDLKADQFFAFQLTAYAFNQYSYPRVFEEILSPPPRI